VTDKLKYFKFLFRS